MRLADELRARVALAAATGDLEQLPRRPEYALWKAISEGGLAKRRVVGPHSRGIVRARGTRPRRAGSPREHRATDARSGPRADAAGSVPRVPPPAAPGRCGAAGVGTKVARMSDRRTPIRSPCGRAATPCTSPCCREGRSPSSKVLPPTIWRAAHGGADRGCRGSGRGRHGPGGRRDPRVGRRVRRPTRRAGTDLTLALNTPAILDRSVREERCPWARARARR